MSIFWITEIPFLLNLGFFSWYFVLIAPGGLFMCRYIWEQLESTSRKALVQSSREVHLFCSFLPAHAWSLFSPTRCFPTFHISTCSPTLRCLLLPIIEVLPCTVISCWKLISYWWFHLRHGWFSFTLPFLHSSRLSRLQKIQLAPPTVPATFHDIRVTIYIHILESN